MHLKHLPGVNVVSPFCFALSSFLFFIHTDWETESRTSVHHWPFIHAIKLQAFTLSGTLKSDFHSKCSFTIEPLMVTASFYFTYLGLWSFSYLTWLTCSTGICLFDGEAGWWLNWIFCSTLFHELRTKISQIYQSRMYYKSRAIYLCVKNFFK